MSILLSLLKGFTTSGSLLVAIGAQNAFVIRQGLKRKHLLLTAFVCSLLDAMLIGFGAIGFGRYISEYPFFLEITKYFAIIFLIVYGCFAFRAALGKNTLKNIEKPAETSTKKLLLSLIALSLLNPHVYLDTVILLGSIASQQPIDEQKIFAMGAISASFAWFFSITFGARFLAPFFQKEYAWKMIDGLIAITMWIIAWNIASST